MTFEELHKNYTRPINICGIYIITNKINNKKYIGKSIDIKRRFQEHINPYEWSRTPNKPLYLAFQKYGLMNFTFDILEECSKEELNMKEKYWITQYNTTNQKYGYNIQSGGEGFSPDEGHPNHKLTVNEVRDIRERYANHERRKDVEELYKDYIGPSGFRKIWQGITWSDIMPEVYTEENKQFHAHNSSCPGSNNGRALLTEEDVYNIRIRKKNGENWQEVYKDYVNTGIKKSSFQQTWQGRNWKHIVVD